MRFENTIPDSPFSKSRVPWGIIITREVDIYRILTYHFHITDTCIVEMVGETGMTPSSTVIMVIITMEMSGLTPIIHHFHSNKYIVTLEMIDDNTIRY